VKRVSEVISPAFYDVHNDIKRGDHSEYMLLGGRGSGKSSFAAVEILLMLLRNENINAIVFRKVAATIRDSVLAQLLWAAEELGIEHLFKTRLAPTEMEYVPTGQKIYFRGADDPGKAKSIKPARGWFGAIWFEETAEFAGMRDIRTLKASAARGGRAVTILTANPPPSPKDWLNLESMRADANRMVHRSDYRSMPREWLGETFLSDAEALRISDEREWRRMYLGEPLGTGAQVFENVTLRKITDEERERFDKIYCGLDFGFAVDPDAFVRLHYDSRLKTAYITDEYRRVRAPMDELAENVKSLMREGECAVCDSADPRMIDEMRRRGISARPAKKGAGSVERGIRFLQELREIVIDAERCPFAAREFSVYEYERDRAGDVIARCPDRDNHSIDAVRYALEEVSAKRAAKSVDRTKIGL